MASWSTPIPAAVNALDQGGDVAGRADADRVAEAELAGAEVEEPPPDRDHLLDRGPRPPQGSPKHIET